MTTTHTPWPSVELLHNVRRTFKLLLEQGADPDRGRLTYRAKVKLDGTNACVQIHPDGSVVAQSRTQVITPESDNMGFARWVKGQEALWSNLCCVGHPVYVFGEWCGQGIQKRTAISQIDRKIFAVFAIVGEDLGSQVISYHPEDIQDFLYGSVLEDVHILPWYGEPVTLDYNDFELLQSQLGPVNKMVKDVEACDPWVASVFGIEGLGEGVVCYPVQGAQGNPLRTASLEGFATFGFKAKGEKHQVVRQGKPAQVDAEAVEGVDAFVSLFVTPARCEQGVQNACEGVLEMKRIGKFLGWMGADIQKESAAELEAAGLEWKQVQKAVQTAVRDWFKNVVESAP